MTSKNKIYGAVAGGAAVLALLAGVVVANAASDDVDVTLAAKNGSGISGSATYGDDGVTGTATGMDPNKRYFSFVYGAGSDATGDNPCILTGETLAGPINTIGQWDVDEDGNGTLDANAPVPADQAGTMSIREDVLGTRGLIGPTPVDSLVACGDVGGDQDTTLGDVQNQLPPLPSTKGVTDGVKDPSTLSTGVPNTLSSVGKTLQGATSEDQDDVGRNDVVGRDDDLGDLVTTGNDDNNGRANN